MLEVTDLNAYYGKSHILRGVNMQVGEGEIVSLLGRNGVGRSTTCKAIMGPGGSCSASTLSAMSVASSSRSFSISWWATLNFVE